MVAVIAPREGMGLWNPVPPRGGTVSRRPMFEASVPLLPGFARRTSLPLLAFVLLHYPLMDRRDPRFPVI